MPRTIRFHLDEHVDHAVADGLRRRSIDCTTTADAGLLGAGDPDQLVFAKSQGRVLFSNDSDFLRAHNQLVDLVLGIDVSQKGWYQFAAFFLLSSAPV